MKTHNKDYMPDITDFFKNYANAINTRYSGYETKAISEISRYIQRKGKYIRPRLFLLTAELYGAEYTPSLVQCACSLELFHLFALAHDDIIDGDTTRGSLASLGCDHNYSRKPKTENRILLGDILYSLAFEAVTSADIYSDTKIELQKLMIETSVITALGVLEEPLLSGKSYKNLDELFRLYWRKTGMYTFSSPMVGGYLARKENRKDNKNYHTRFCNNNTRQDCNENNLKESNKNQAGEIGLLNELGSLWGCAYQLQDDYQDCRNILQINLSNTPAEPINDISSHKKTNKPVNTSTDENPNDRLLEELFSSNTADKEKYGTFDNYVSKNTTLLLHKARETAEKLDLPENSRQKLINFAESFF